MAICFLVVWEEDCQRETGAMTATNISLHLIIWNCVYMPSIKLWWKINASTVMRMSLLAKMRPLSHAVTAI